MDRPTSMTIDREHRLASRIEWLLASAICIAGPLALGVGILLIFALVKSP